VAALFQGNPMGLPLHRTRRMCTPVMWSDVIFTSRVCRLRPDQIPGTSACPQSKQIPRSLRQTLLWMEAPRLFAFNFEVAAILSKRFSRSASCKGNSCAKRQGMRSSFVKH
jgi:hypothetical protein